PPPTQLSTPSLHDALPISFGGTRTAMLAPRSGAGFPQQLFVDLRRAGWPVSPVIEGRIQIEGRSFRLLGIEPVTLPAEVGNAPADRKSTRLNSSHVAISYA